MILLAVGILLGTVIGLVISIAIAGGRIDGDPWHTWEIYVFAAAVTLASAAFLFVHLHVHATRPYYRLLLP